MGLAAYAGRVTKELARAVGEEEDAEGLLAPQHVNTRWQRPQSTHHLGTPSSAAVPLLVDLRQNFDADMQNIQMLYTEKEGPGSD